MTFPLIRPARLSDLPHLIHFAKRVGFGITSLPNSPAELERKLSDSERSFRYDLRYPQHETYLFCLEHEGVVVGTSGIISRIGMSEPFFAYHLLHEHVTCPYLNIEKETAILHFIQARKKPTEIGTLFLEPAFRKKNWGKLLSFCRFLFIAQFPERFATTVIAELRGINENGISPFWEAIGRPFFQLEFSEADYLRTEHHACIEELFPKYPIYVDLLPQEAQKVIGKVHPDTEPALKILFEQGFRISHYVDLFDAGPHLFTPTQEIDAVNGSLTAPIRISHSPGSTWAFVANTELDFRATLAPITLDDGHVHIEHPLAEILRLKEGQTLRYYI